MPQSVTKLWDDSKGEVLPGVDRYLEVLKLVISDSYDRLYIVVDAWDEYPEEARGKLLDTITERIVPKKVSVLLTTRETWERHDDLKFTCNDCGFGASLLYYRCKCGKHDICQPCKDRGGECHNCAADSNTFTAPDLVVKDIRTPDDEIERFVRWDLGETLDEGSNRQGDERLKVRIVSSRLGRLCERSPDLKDDIPIKIRQQAKGMFLLAKLHLDTLKEKGTVNEVKRGLDSLSDLGSVTKIYENIFVRIQNKNRDDLDRAKKALLWVTSARRPLTVQELLHVLAIKSSQTTIDKGDLTDWDLIQNNTSGLIVKGAEIEDVDHEDPKHTVVSFAHRTAADFFLKNRSRLLEDTTSTEIEHIPTYLSFPALAKPCGGKEEDAEIDKRLEEFPFLAYASQYVSQTIRSKSHSNRTRRTKGSKKSNSDSG